MLIKFCLETSHIQETYLISKQLLEMKKNCVLDEKLVVIYHVAEQISFILFQKRHLNKNFNSQSLKKIEFY